MKYDTLIFDLDGTLINTIDDLTDSVNYALGAMGYPPRATEEVRSFVGNGIKRLVYLSVPFGTAQGQKEECLSVFREYYPAHSMIKTRPYDGIDGMLTAVRKAGIKTAVVTNKTEAAAKNIVRSFFGDRIDVIIGQVDGVKQKPEPDGVYRAIELLGSEKSRCVYVGDSEVDCLAARNAGLEIIGCSWGFRGRETLEKEGADYIIDKPADIMKILNR